MGNYKIGRKRTKDDAIIRTMYWDDDGLQLFPNKDGSPPMVGEGGEAVEAPSIKWYLTTLKGRHGKKIQDEMVEMDTRKSTAKMRTGTASESRIIASVVFVEGIEWENGSPITVMDQRVYADLEQWQINQLGEWIDELNQDSEKAQAKAKGES